MNRNARFPQRDQRDTTISFDQCWMSAICSINEKQDPPATSHFLWWKYQPARSTHSLDTKNASQPPMRGSSHYYYYHSLSSQRYTYHHHHHRNLYSYSCTTGQPTPQKKQISPYNSWSQQVTSRASGADHHLLSGQLLPPTNPPSLPSCTSVLRTKFTFN